MKENLDETYSRKAYNWLKKKWYVTTIISAFPGTLLSFLGISKDIEWFKFLYNQNSYIKIGYIIVFAVVTVGCIGISMLWHWVNYHEEDSNMKLSGVYKETKKMVRCYHNKCHREFSDIVHKEEYKGSVLEVLKTIKNAGSQLNPATKIDNILDAANNLLSYAFGIEPEKISIVLAYKECPDTQWTILKKRNITYETTEISELFNNPNSAFSTALQQRTWPVFYLKKEDAVMNNQYIPSKYENANGLKGSIYCRDLSLYKDKKLQKGFVFAVSTNDKRFAKNNTYGRNVCSEIFELIEDMLRPELDHIYMSEYFDLGGYIDGQEKTSVLHQFVKKTRG